MEEEVKKAIANELAKVAMERGEIVIRTGEALEQQEPARVSIIGILDTPLRWLEKRAGDIDERSCYVAFCREKMAIELIINEHDYYKDEVEGRLQLSPEFQKFGINGGQYMTGLQLSDMIRMNRSFFTDKTKAMELVTIMRNFKATVTTQLEASDDKRGNTAQVRRQTVEGNQPPSFELCIPIFKGQPKQTFTVEIDIDPDTLQATLVSPDAQDMIAETRDKLMDEVLRSMQEVCPHLVIVEI